MLYNAVKVYDVSHDSTKVFGVSATWFRLLTLTDFYWPLNLYGKQSLVESSTIT